MEDKIPSSINPSEQFLDLHNFFEELSIDYEKRIKENRKSDVFGFALFEDRKPLKDGAAMVTTCKIFNNSKRSKDIVRMANLLAYEMQSDSRIMAVVNMAVSRILLESHLKYMSDDKDNKDDKDKKE